MESRSGPNRATEPQSLRRGGREGVGRVAGDAQETYLLRPACWSLGRRDQLRHRGQVVGMSWVPRWLRRAGRSWGSAGGRGAGRCRALPRGHTGLGRAVTGTRGCECAMRARRGRCACPRVPLPSRRSSGRQNGKRTTRTRQPPAARRGEIRDGGRGVVAPRSLGPPHGVPESERGRQRAGCTAASTPGGCRPRPPAAQALPLFSPPPALSRTPCKEARPVCSSRAARSRT